MSCDCKSHVFSLSKRKIKEKKKEKLLVFKYPITDIKKKY